MALIRCSHCGIRLDNNDLLRLAEQVHTGMVVAILPSESDVKENANK